MLSVHENPVIIFSCPAGGPFVAKPHAASRKGVEARKVIVRFIGAFL